MSETLGFALVGCGDIGWRNAQSIAQADGASLVRLVDIDVQAAGKLAERFSVPVSPSFTEALTDRRVDAVFIATPHDLHAPMVIEAAKAGKHVIVEKPMATTVADAEAAIAACENAAVSLSVCHPRRYEEKIKRARELVEEGNIGSLLLTNSRFVKERTPDYWSRAPWRRKRSRSGGGVLITNLIHHIDALQVITGHRIITAVGLTATQSGNAEVEDSAAVAVRYDSGALGTLAACSSIPGKKAFEDQVYGKKGRLIVEKRTVRLQMHDSYVSGEPESWTVFDFEEDSVSKTRFIESFAASVKSSEPPPLPGSYGLELLRIVLNVYQTPHATMVSSNEEVI
ncbi:MAG: Gfo/Idh/MocA family oxidoreductase [Phycisphaerae bacterium]